MKSSLPPNRRLDAIATALERLASDMDILGRGADALHYSLPPEFKIQRDLLAAQSAAMERVSISLCMVRQAVSELAEAGT